MAGTPEPAPQPSSQPAPDELAADELAPDELAADERAADERASEQAHLARARAEPARMRSRTAGLGAMPGDRIFGQMLQATLAARVRALTDDPGRTLFFGRTDTSAGNRWYIGRGHVADDAGDPVVVDWRADVSRGAPGHCWHVGHDGHGPRGVRGRYLQRCPRPGGGAARVGPMRDIVATIQPQQDEIMRADLATSVCVQGAPGTGKTAVGLHRAAWLLYAFADRLSRAGVLVVGPSEAILEHVGAVLPALGEVRVRHSTAAELTSAVPVRHHDEPAAVATLGSARMAQVLHRAVWSNVDADAVARGGALVVPRGIHRWRVPAYVLAELVGELSSRGARYGAARAMLAQRAAHRVLLMMERSGDSPDDRVQDSVARSRELRAWVAGGWPALTPEGGVAQPVAPRSPRSAKWSAADAVLADEVADLLQRTSSLGHVILDEAQDLSPMQLRAVGRRASTGSMTVLGAIAQGTTGWATDSWDDALRHLGHPDAELEVLVRGFRVPAAVIDPAAGLLPAIAPGLDPPVAGALWPTVVRAVLEVSREPGSVGVVVADAATRAAEHALQGAGLDPLVLGRDHEDAAHRVHVVPASLAKGLELDLVVVVEPREIVAAEPDRRTGLRRLYVVLTRAVSALVVVHHRPLPTELDG